MRRNEARSVITCDLEGRIETCNKGAQRLFGHTPDEVIGRERADLFVKKKHRSYPVLKNNRLLGMISRQDVVRAILERA